LLYDLIAGIKFDGTGDIQEPAYDESLYEKGCEAAKLQKSKGSRQSWSKNFQYYVEYKKLPLDKQKQLAADGDILDSMYSKVETKIQQILKDKKGNSKQ
jgi:hypothetical protein